MFFLLCVVLYFLPSIIGRDKRNAASIFLLNLLLGWTVVGWVVALIWACAADFPSPVFVVAGPGRFCSACGTLSPAGGRYCSACGRAV